MRACRPGAPDHVVIDSIGRGCNDRRGGRQMCNKKPVRGSHDKWSERRSNTEKVCAFSIRFRLICYWFPLSFFDFPLVTSLCLSTVLKPLGGFWLQEYPGGLQDVRRRALVFLVGPLGRSKRSPSALWMAFGRNETIRWSLGRASEALSKGQEKKQKGSRTPETLIKTKWLFLCFNVISTLQPINTNITMPSL